MIRVALLAFVILLAGCADPAVDAKASTDEPNSGLGAIQGIVADERFRPINGALVVLSELALETHTDQDGFFAFTDIPPGDYTLRTSSAGHKQSNETITVRADEISDPSILTPRVFSTGGDVATYEFVLFIDCELNLALTSQGCSTNAPRNTLDLDYTNELPDHIILEASFSTDTLHRIIVTSTKYLASREGSNTDMGIILTHNATSPFDLLGPNSAFDSGAPFHYEWQALGLGADQQQQGIGAQVAVRADITVTLITGGLDPADYCSSC